MPFDSIEEQVAHLPDDPTITITASPTLGLEATITWTETLAEEGYEVVPHIAARYVRDRDHLGEIARRLTDVGVTALFVPGGDREEPVGEFESAYELLVALDDL
ncbi:MAG: methylenetetrahydrofolate reductase, partial [Halobacteriota archaeon]